jgi:uncharacterized protein involved in exopolysaccharide biosynthesis
VEPLNVIDPGSAPPEAFGARPEGGGRAREVLTVAFKQRRRMTLVFGVVLALVAALLVLQRPAYEAQASILVEYGREYRPELGQERPIPVTPEEVLNSEVQILTGENLIREVVQSFGVDELYPRSGLLTRWTRRTLSVPDAARQFRKSLSAEAIRRSSVLQVTLKHRDPKVAADALHLLLERYKQRHLEVVQNDTTLQLLEGQLTRYEERLRDSEGRWEAFRQDHGVYDFGEQMTQLLRRRGDLQAAQRQARIDLGEYQRRLDSLGASLQLPRPLEVQGDIQKDVIRLQGEAQSRRARIGQVQSALADVEQQIRQMDQNQVQLAALRRELTDNEKNYQTYKAKVEELRLSSTMNQQRISNITVIDEGGVPTRPAGPGLLARAALGVALALLSAVIAAFLAEQSRQGLSSPEAAERRLGLPVLVTVRRLT